MHTCMMQDEFVALRGSVEEDGYLIAWVGLVGRWVGFWVPMEMVMG